jgi:hypothetical protein
MLPNEIVKDIYSHLNLIVNGLNAIGLTKVSDADVVRKIILVLLLPDKISILHNTEDLSTMTSSHIIGKIVTFEILRKMGLRRSYCIKQVKHYSHL